METVTSNIEKNKYGFVLDEETLRRKGGGVPLVATHELVDAIYREGTTVSVEDTPRDDSSLSNLEIAMVHEYGTKDKHIPARPVWRYTFRDYKPTAKKHIQDFLDSKGKFNSNGTNSSKRLHKAK